MQCDMNPRMENTMRAGHMTTTTELFTDREGAAMRGRDVEPIEDPVLADAEEEEYVELWASDRGNQGA